MCIRDRVLARRRPRAPWWVLCSLVPQSQPPSLFKVAARAVRLHACTVAATSRLKAALVRDKRAH
eukprot:3369105-Alexandrium_andersonii.AAC.1